MASDAQSGTYVLHDGGDWFYYLGDGETFYADGSPMRQAAERGWWVADHEASVIEREHPPTKKLLEWKLIDPFPPTEEYPATLTIEEHRGRYDFGDGDPKVGVLYEGVYEDVPTRREVIDTRFIVLDGSPSPVDGLTWEAQLPFALRYATQYRHLFPGRLTGFRAALIERLEKIPGVSAYDQSKFSVYVKVRYEKPVPGKNLAGKRIQVKEVTRTVPISPPRTVEGNNRADAKAEWDHLMTRYVEEVMYWTEARICSHCGGEGILDPKKEKVVA